MIEKYPKMRLTVGLGSVDDYPEFVRAGADEVFCGYIPDSWMRTAGMDVPMNRREVRYVNVQIGSWSEMEILADMRDALGVPVTVTMNSPCYDPAYYPAILETMQQCAEAGFCSFIVADPGLILYRKEHCSPEERKQIHLHLSGEFGEINRYVVGQAEAMDISRIIFQRKCSIPNMTAMIRGYRKDYPQNPMDFEAFLLNEMCEFSGCYCNSLHCDEFAPACRIPYRMERKRWEETTDDEEEDRSEDYVIGRGGCGLCALWRLREAGVNRLKIVSRGNYSDDTIRDIRAARRALDLLEESGSEEEYIWRMKEAIFPNGCGGACYYRI